MWIIQRQYVIVLKNVKHEEIWQQKAFCGIVPKHLLSPHVVI